MHRRRPHHYPYSRSSSVALAQVGLVLPSPNGSTTQLSPTEVSTSNSSISPTTICQSSTNPTRQTLENTRSNTLALVRDHFARRLFRLGRPRIQPPLQRRHQEHSRFLIPRMALHASAHPQLWRSGARYAGGSGPKAGARVAQDFARRRRLSIAAHGAAQGWGLHRQRDSGQLGQLPAGRAGNHGANAHRSPTAAKPQPMNVR